MSQPTPEQPRRSPRELDPRSTHSIVVAVSESALMPVDYVVDAIKHCPDARAWLEAAIEAICGAKLPVPPVDAGADAGGEAISIGSVVRGECSVLRLERLRQRSVVLFGAAATVEGRNHSLATFAVAVASGLVHHDTLLTSQPRAEVDVMLSELAAVVPPDVSALLERAVLHGGSRESCA